MAMTNIRISFFQVVLTLKEIMHRASRAFVLRPFARLKMRFQNRRITPEFQKRAEKLDIVENIKNLILNSIIIALIGWFIYSKLSHRFRKPEQETSGLKLTQLSPEEIVVHFADQFLDDYAQERVRAPRESEYEALFDLTEDEIPPLFWGEILIEEILTITEFGLFLDWKYNVLTLMLDDDPESNILSRLFEANGLAPVSDDERKTILDIAHKKYGDRPDTLMLPTVQELAIKRGHRLLVIDNNSDMQVLISLPKDQAEKWHLVHVGDALFIDATHPVVDDPRYGNKNRLVVD